MIDYYKIEALNEKIRKNTATVSERDEYMRILHQNGSITPKMYDNYLKDKNEPDTLSAAITIGGIILLGYIISKLTEK